MQKIRKFLLDKVPLYGWLAIIAIVTVNMLVYYGSRLLTSSMTHHNITSAVDRHIPFVPAFVLVYIIVAYGQWWFGYYLAAREDKKTVLTIFSAELIAKLLCLVVFLVYPTTMDRAQITGTDVFSRMVELLYSADTPDNLFPSIHCLESYLLWRTLPLLKKAPAWYKKVTPFISLSVFASVLLVKQHVAVDILGAIVVTEIGLLTMKLIMKYRDRHSR